MLELTFAILKPHIIKHPIALDKIRNIILTSNFKIVESRRHTLTMKEAETFYKDHKNKFFYDRLVSFMISGPSDLYILACEDALKKWRQLMGPTKVFKTIFEAPDTIRGQFGLSDTRNATHGSDSPDSARSEIGIFFPNFDVADWYKHREPRFRLINQTQFISDNFVHKLIDDVKN